MQLKILSWNIWYDGDFEEISRFLRTCNADIIGLQEVVSNDPTRDVLGYLEKLGYNSFFAPALILEDGRIVGNAILSRYPIMQRTTHVLPDAQTRNAVQIDMRVNDVLLHVFNTHFLHTDQKESEVQTKQAERFIEILPRASTIAMGDFNATPESVVIQKMRAVMRDTDPASTPTIHADLFDCPRCDSRTIANTRLDYIFTSKDIKPSAFTVEHSNGSDHFPISVIVEI